MTESSSAGTLRPLSIGNIVSAGVRLYRERAQEYFSLSIVTYLWIFIPVYGWAKFAMLSGAMSRLAFQDLIGEPETVDQARGRLRPRLWGFLGLAFAVFIRLFGIYILGAIAFGALTGISAAVSPVLGVLVGLVAFLVWIIVLIRFFSRWFVAELPMGVEEGATPARSLDRSWQLTQQAVGRMQIVALVTSLITIPLAALSGYGPTVFFAIAAPDFAATPLASLITFAISLAGSIVILPFWQIVKAVTYYDLRSRKEGLDLELRGDRDI